MDAKKPLFTLRTDTGEYNRVATQLYAETYIACIKLGKPPIDAFAYASCAVVQLSEVTQFAANLGL